MTEHFTKTFSHIFLNESLFGNVIEIVQTRRAGRELSQDGGWGCGEIPFWKNTKIYFKKVYSKYINNSSVHNENVNRRVMLFQLFIDLHTLQVGREPFIMELINS